MTDRDFWQDRLASDCAIIECATVDTTFYAAVARPSGQVDAFIALQQWTRAFPFNFTHKTMSDTSGPNAAAAPARVLDALSPTTDAYALDWRAACRARLERRSAAARVRPGDTVTFATPMNFTDGSTRDTFTFVARSTFTPPDGSVRFRIPQWRTKAFSVTPPTNS